MDYYKNLHRIGKMSCIIAILLILMVPAVVTIAYRGEINIDIPSTIAAIITLTAIYGPISLIEVVSYSPVLGTGGTYLSFITGNIMNMKLPAASNALMVNNVERGTDEAEVISTLAIGASSIVTTFMMFVGMLFLGRFLVPIITSPAMAPAFNNVMPALLGSLSVPYFLKEKKLSWLPILGGIVIYLVMGNAYMATHSSLWMLPFILIVFAIYMLMYKFGIIKENN